MRRNGRERPKLESFRLDTRLKSQQQQSTYLNKRFKNRQDVSFQTNFCITWKWQKVVDFKLSS